MSNNAVAVIENPRELSVTEVKSQVAKVQELMHDLMQEGTHYGESFPGDTKKNLLKPGADKLCFMFRLRPDFTQEIKELPNGHMEVLTRCQIFHIESGQKFAEGVGLATTMESKYRWRNATRKCPVCGKEAIIKGKESYGGGYICFAKKGGCGAKFRDDNPIITDQVLGKVENPDIADAYNTVIKMSKKRAYVDATITACAASDIFSQDAEDFRDVTEPLVQEAGPEGLRNVTEEPSNGNLNTTPATPPANPLYQKCVDGMNELRNIMLTSAAGLRLFSDNEYDVVKTALKELTKKPDEERWAAISEILDDKKERLQIRLDALNKTRDQQPSATTEGVASSERPSLADEYRRTLAEKNQQAQAAETTVPAMYTGTEDDGFRDDLFEEPVPATADAELDVF